MKKADYHQTALLRERIEQNYADFKAETIRLDSKSVFELASTIAAVSDAHFYMTTHEWADCYATDFLLKCENPLKQLAEEWEAYREDMGEDFGKMLTNLAANWDEDYFTGTIAEEMREEDCEEYDYDMDDY